MRTKTTFKAAAMILGAAALLASCDQLFPSGDPTSLSATDGEKEITISWDAPVFPEGEEKTVDFYRLYRNNVEIAQPPGSSYVDSGLVSGIEYDYYVYAEFSDWTSSGNSNTDTGYAVDATILQVGEGMSQYPEQANAEATGAWFSILVQEGWPYTITNDTGGSMQLYRKGEDISVPDVDLGPVFTAGWTGDQTGVYFINVSSGAFPVIVSVWHH